jgi:signal transduction histidine kinase
MSPSPVHLGASGGVQHSICLGPLESMKRPRDWSLRNRLIVLAAVASIIAWLTGGLAVLFAAREEGERLHDTRLEDVARVVLQFAAREIDEVSAEHPGNVVHLETAQTLDPRYRYQVWSARGDLLLVSTDAPRDPFAPLDVSGHQARAFGGHEYRVFSLWSRDRAMQIQVAERADLRDFVFGRVARSLLLFFVVSTAALALLNWWMFGRATRALDVTAHQLTDRAADDQRPLVVDDPPRELRPILESLNALFRRFGRALDAERHFTAAAAHELRTPLAAVRVQAQVADRARTPKEAHAALVQLGVCVDRASRMIDQLLTLAQFETTRLSPETATPVQVATLAAQVVNDMTPLLRSRSIVLTTKLEPATVVGLEFGLAALLRNLLDNAARYCPPNGRVHIECGEENGKVFLTVHDSGPGIPVEERERVFERFYRLQNNGTDGCGVGLSIVQSVARAHGARIMLADSELGGLRAAVFLSKDLAQTSTVEAASTSDRSAATTRSIEAS